MDEVGVVNAALALIKAPAVTSLYDGSERARLAQLRYANCRDSVLEALPWGFANMRVTLTQSTRRPAFQWAYQYRLPYGNPDPWCIKVREPNPTVLPWEVGYDAIDERVLLTDQATMKIRYTAQIVNITVWSPQAVLALTYLLASEFAAMLTGDANRVKLFTQSYMTTLAEAIISDSREGSPVLVPAPQDFTWIR